MNPLHVLSWDLYEDAMTGVDCRVALDIGANEGGYTQTLLDHGFEVHAFEPVPEMFNRLFDRHGSNPKAFLNQMALSNKRGRLRNVTVLEAWTIGNVGDGGMAIKPEYEERQIKHYFDVLLWTVDDYIRSGNVGLIKLDVDGYEPRVLEGARKTLDRCKPPILCELSCYIERLGTPAEKFAELVFSLGYTFFSMDGKYECDTWAKLKPCYPHNTSFDVMLLPKNPN